MNSSLCQFKKHMTPLMSFWPDVYNRILKSEKLFEYRRIFPKNCTHAFMYVSSPVKAICGIIYFEDVYKLSDLIDSCDEVISDRINRYLPKYQYAGSIKAVQRIKPIHLEELKLNLPNFTAPQSYLYIDNYPELKDFLLKNVKFDGQKISNIIDILTLNHICS